MLAKLRIDRKKDIQRRSLRSWLSPKMKTGLVFSSTAKS